MRVCNVVAFAGGVLAGGIIALLFAPKKGVELRADIKEKLGDIKKHVDGAMCGENCRCGENVTVTVEE